MSLRKDVGDMQPVPGCKNSFCSTIYQDAPIGIIAMDEDPERLKRPPITWQVKGIKWLLWHILRSTCLIIVLP